MYRRGWVELFQGSEHFVLQPRVAPSIVAWANFDKVCDEVAGVTGVRWKKNISPYLDLA